MFTQPKQRSDATATITHAETSPPIVTPPTETSEQTRYRNYAIPAANAPPLTRRHASATSESPAPVDTTTPPTTTAPTPAIEKLGPSTSRRKQAALHTIVSKRRRTTTVASPSNSANTPPASTPQPPGSPTDTETTAPSAVNQPSSSPQQSLLDQTPEPSQSAQLDSDESNPKPQLPAPLPTHLPMSSRSLLGVGRVSYHHHLLREEIRRSIQPSNIRDMHIVCEMESLDIACLKRMGLVTRTQGRYTFVDSRAPLSRKGCYDSKASTNPLPLPILRLPPLLLPHLPHALLKHV